MTIVKIIHERYSYDPITGIITKKRCGKPVTCKNGLGYLHLTTTTVNGEQKTLLAHRVAWCLYYGELPEKDLDHINRIKHDNRIENLRETTRSANNRNRSNSSEKQSRFDYVIWNKQKGKWQARFKGKHYGFFETEEEAHLALPF